MKPPRADLSGCRLRLHPPASHRPELDISEHQVLDREADEDHTEKPCEDARHLELILFS